MSKFKKLVLDGRVINVSKESSVLERRLRLQGAVNSDVAMADRMQQLRTKYPGVHTLIV